MYGEVRWSERGDMCSLTYSVIGVEEDGVYICPLSEVAHYGGHERILSVNAVNLMREPGDTSALPSLSNHFVC